MKPSDLVALNYKMKHAKSKRKAIDEYPELRKKAITDIKGIIDVNNMIRTGLSVERLKELRKLSSLIIGRRNKYGRRNHSRA